MRGIKKNRFSLKALTLAVAAVCTAGTAHAFKVDAGPDWDMQFDNTVQWTMGWRAQSLESKIGNGPFFQAGDYKFQHKGDMVTNRVQDLIEFQGTYQQNMGFRMSASVWKDFNYTDHVAQNPAYAAAGSHVYTNDTYTNATKHYFLQGGDWLDGFVFYNTQIFDHNVYAKVGRLTQYWGNAFFFAFSNIAYSQSPIDFNKAFTQPGSEVKELFLPRNQILVSADLTQNLSVTGEYFLEYRQNLYPEAGTYFGFFDVLYNGPVGPGTGNAFATGALGLDAYKLGNLIANHGNAQPQNNNHNFGLKLTWTEVPLIGGDMGFYYRQLDEVDPFPLINAGVYNLNQQLKNTNGTSISAGTIYNTAAQKTKLFGISFEKTFGLISTGWELSTRRHTEIASSFVAGPDGLGARGNITNLIGNTFVQLGGNSIGNMKLWDSGILLAEFSFTHLNSVTDNPDQASFVGRKDSTGAFICNPTGAASGGRDRDGCATKNSLAIAMLFIPQWQQVWAGVDLEAPISYTYGVHGNPAYRASAFYQEGTNIYSFGLRAIYQQKHQLTLSYNGNTWRTNTSGSLPTGPVFGTPPPGQFYNGFGGAGPVGVNDRGWVELQYKTSF